MQLVTKRDGVVRPPQKYSKKEMEGLTEETKRKIANCRRVTFFSASLKNRRSGNDPEEFGSTVADTKSPSVIDEAADHEQLDKFHARLRWLPKRSREILRLRFVEELTLLEVGHVLGITRERVRQLELKALKTIHKGIKQGRPISPEDTFKQKQEQESEGIPDLLPLLLEIPMKACAFCTKTFQPANDTVECCSRSCAKRKQAGWIYDSKTGGRPPAKSSRPAETPTTPTTKEPATNGQVEHSPVASTPTTIQLLEKELERKRAEAAEIEAALRVLRRMESQVA